MKKNTRMLKDYRSNMEDILLFMCYNNVGGNMNIEDTIFKKSVPNYEKLVNYGFKKNGEEYVFRKNLIDNFLDSQLLKAEEQEKKFVKMYKTLGITIGTAITIVLI